MSFAQGRSWPSIPPGQGRSTNKNLVRSGEPSLRWDTARSYIPGIASALAQPRQLQRPAWRTPQFRPWADGLALLFCCISTSQETTK